MQTPLSTSIKLPFVIHRSLFRQFDYPHSSGATTLRLGRIGAPAIYEARAGAMLIRRPVLAVSALGA
jgi:hypothetical protein